MKMVIRTKIIHTQKKMKMKNQFHIVKKSWKKMLQKEKVEGRRCFRRSNKKKKQKEKH